jgi:hypothetical protein
MIRQEHFQEKVKSLQHIAKLREEDIIENCQINKRLE